MNIKIFVLYSLKTTIPTKTVHAATKTIEKVVRNYQIGILMQSLKEVCPLFTVYS